MTSIHEQAWNGTLSDGPNFDATSLNFPRGPHAVTPLAAACWNGHLDVVRLLLRKRANPNARSRHGTPLHYATLRCPAADRLAIVRELLDHGADVNAQHTITDSRATDDDDDEENTALINAVINRDKALVHELIDRGASLTLTNGMGQTAGKLAQGTEMEIELRPQAERNANFTQLIDLIVKFLILLIAYTNNETVKFIASGVAEKVARDLSEEPHQEEEDPAVELLFKRLKGYVANELKYWR